MKIVKNTVPWIYVISDLNGKHIFGINYQKELEKQIKKILELKIVLKEKAINYMSNGKSMMILLTVGLIKKT